MQVFITGLHLFNFQTGQDFLPQISKLMYMHHIGVKYILVT